MLKKMALKRYFQLKHQSTECKIYLLSAWDFSYANKFFSPCASEHTFRMTHHMNNKEDPFVLESILDLTKRKKQDKRNETRVWKPDSSIDPRLAQLPHLQKPMIN